MGVGFSVVLILSHPCSVEVAPLPIFLLVTHWLVTQWSSNWTSVQLLLWTVMGFLSDQLLRRILWTGTWWESQRRRAGNLKMCVDPESVPPTSEAVNKAGGRRTWPRIYRHVSFYHLENEELEWSARSVVTIRFLTIKIVSISEFIFWDLGYMSKIKRKK